MMSGILNTQSYSFHFTELTCFFSIEEAVNSVAAVANNTSNKALQLCDFQPPDADSFRNMSEHFFLNFYPR